MNLFKIAGKSVLYDRKGTIYQILIIVLLTGVITGSILTGNSVRNSLRKTGSEMLGNTGILISSGIRYFSPLLAKRMADETGIKCTGVLEINGYCQNFSNGQTSPSVKIYAIDNDYFRFQGHDTIILRENEVAVNERLASYLGLKEGDDIIIRFASLSDLPADAPFSPDKNGTESLVMKTGKILEGSESGNFSLGITQITPMNIFINLTGLADKIGNLPGINRLLFKKSSSATVASIYNSLTRAMKPADIGLSVRRIPSTGAYEIISDRIFIDQLITDEIDKLPVPSFHVLTYMANSIGKGNKFTPYSFVSALDPELYPGIPEGNGIEINQWMADDIGAKTGDTLNLTWYSPDPQNRLVVKNQDFVISDIVEMKGIYGDSLLMPEFPGIAGKESCSDWDAGVSVNMDLIRNKDEEYWNTYKGTPKAFINYEKGKEIWGSNFGPVTAIRFPAGVDEDQIHKAIDGSIDPYKSGFTVTDLPAVTADAADNGVDFSSLFLGLGFFIIVSAIILLILVISTSFEAKTKQIHTLFAIGFSNKNILRMLMLETAMTALAGTVLGALGGGLFNNIVIGALNSVWQGAVQTDTLTSGFYPLPVATGFISCLIIILVILRIKAGRFLKQLNTAETGIIKRPSVRLNRRLSAGFIIITIILTVFSFFSSGDATILSYSAGISAFAAMIFIIRQRYLNKISGRSTAFRDTKQISSLFYSFNSSHAIAPVLFLAAGLFAVIITGVNRMNISDTMLERSGGTGGFILWGESPVPVPGDLNSNASKHEYGLDDDSLKTLAFVQISKTSGNDASCLNLNHITTPPLAGVDPEAFISRVAFSFASVMKGIEKENPWMTLDNPPDDSTIYAIADQTVLQYGLKIKTGDTLKIRSENGQILNVVISAGLKSSVFQGYVLTGNKDFSRFFPSVSGSQIFLVDGKRELTDNYRELLNDRLSEYGIRFEPASERLESFFVVTNTYLTVFTLLGGIGMILGVAGLGFILIRNFNQRKRDFGLMMAAGFSLKTIRSMIFREHAEILIAGIITGVVSAFLATRPSLINASVPWTTIAVMIILIFITGLAALLISSGSVKKDDLISRIRKE